MVGEKNGTSLLLACVRSPEHHVPVRSQASGLPALPALECQVMLCSSRQTWTSSAEAGPEDNPVCTCKFHLAYTGTGLCKESQGSRTFHFLFGLLMNSAFSKAHMGEGRLFCLKPVQASGSQWWEAAGKEEVQARELSPRKPGLFHPLGSELRGGRGPCITLRLVISPACTFFQGTVAAANT